MGAVQHRICPLCGKSSGERFRDETLPCRYCNNEIETANKIKRFNKLNCALSLFIIVCGLLIFIFGVFK